MRYFRATAMVGRLHLLDISDYGPWEPSRIVYTEEREADLILAHMVMRKVRTVQDLEDVLRASQGRAGSISLYVSESVLDDAKRR